MVKLEELEVGQTVEHESGFIGKVFEVESDGGVRIEVTDPGTSEYGIGYKYYANYNWIVRIVEPAPNPHKLVIDVELKGMDKALEQAKEMVLVAEDMADIRKEESYFNAELGNGITFKGTKSDFKVFMEGVTEMLTVAKNMGL